MDVVIFGMSRSETLLVVNRLGDIRLVAVSRTGGH